ncbi:MAG TPA: CDP-alcohol phosphatidyltransferase family protein [Bacteroidales bacterium]
MRINKPFTSHIPNLITSLNLLAGCISIVFTFHDQVLIASILIFVAGIFDFFDGLVARALKAYSDIGKMLDSLADIVSFGVAPSAILFNYLNISLHPGNPGFDLNSNNWMDYLIPCIAFLIAIFSAIRLAKFTIDERQTAFFIGVPTPANAFVIASLPFILQGNLMAQSILLKIYILVPLILVLSLLLVSEIPMISLKFKNLTYKDNKSRFILVISSLLLLILLRIKAFPIIFLLYLIISLIDNPQKSSIV